jgi:hypothetical protein
MLLHTITSKISIPFSSKAGYRANTEALFKYYNALKLHAASELETAVYI